MTGKSIFGKRSTPSSLKAISPKIARANMIIEIKIGRLTERSERITGDFLVIWIQES